MPIIDGGTVIFVNFTILGLFWLVLGVARSKIVISGFCFFISDSCRDYASIKYYISTDSSIRRVSSAPNLACKVESRKSYWTFLSKNGQIALPSTKYNFTKTWSFPTSVDYFYIYVTGRVGSCQSVVTFTYF